MINILVPILILILSGGLFFGPTKGLIDKINQDNADKAQVDLQIKNLADYAATFDTKNKAFNSVTEQDRDALDAMIPADPDNVQLIIDINQIAVNHQLNIKNISVKTSADSTVGPDSRPYGVITMNFSVSSSYKVFKDFLHDLENSLRLIDVSSLSFTAGSQDQYDFNLAVKTYWLKSNK